MIIQEDVMNTNILKSLQKFLETLGLDEEHIFIIDPPFSNYYILLVSL